MPDIENEYSTAIEALSAGNDQLAQQLLLFRGCVLQPGTEGFGDVALRLITSIADNIGRLFSVYKLVYRSFRNLKRTEIHSYQEKYFATFSRVKRVSFLEVKSLEIPVPKNMNCAYVKALNAILTCLHSCDMVNRSRAFAKITTDIESQVKSGGSTSSTVAGMYGQNTDIGQLELRFKQVESCFGKKSGSTVPFSDGFSSMDEFNTVATMLDTGSTYEYDTSKVFNNLQICETAMRNTAAAAKGRKLDNIPLSKDELIALSEATLFMAKTFDVFGLVVQDLNRVEHNYVEVCKLVARKFKL